MDALERERLKREVDKRVRRRVARMKNNRKGRLNIKVIEGDSYSADWPPRLDDGGEIMNTYRNHRSQFNKYHKRRYP